MLKRHCDNCGELIQEQNITVTLSGNNEQHFEIFLVVQERKFGKLEHSDICPKCLSLMAYKYSNIILPDEEKTEYKGK